MANQLSSIQLQRTLQMASVFVRQAPLTNVGGFALEPGFSIADWVRQFILAPPFAWRWNRAVATFQTAQAQQDYSVSIPAPGLGWIEKATVNDGVVHELEVALNLSEESGQELPTKIAARLDDGLGNITFRLTPVPPKVYTVTVTYQKAAPTFVNLTDTWQPIPDYLSFLFNTGVLAKAYEYWSDERYPFTMQLFMRQVIAANEGLTESQVNLFLSERVNTARQMNGQMGNNQAGRQGRGGF